MIPIDDAWRVLKALPERQISISNRIPTKYRQDARRYKTAHPSISDERLADAYYDKDQNRHNVDSSVWDTRRGLGKNKAAGEWVSNAEAHQDTNRGKNSLLTRIKQLPKRTAIDLGTHQRVEGIAARANRDYEYGGGNYDESRYQRERDDVIRQRNEWANRMSWTDANQANEEAQAQMQAGTLEMQPAPQPPAPQPPAPQPPAPQPPDPSKMMMGEPMDIAWGVLG